MNISIFPVPLNVPILICCSYHYNILCFLIYFLLSIYVCQWLCACAWKFPRQGQIWPPGWSPLTTIGKSVTKTSSPTFRAVMTAVCVIRLGILTFPPYHRAAQEIKTYHLNQAHSSEDAVVSRCPWRGSITAAAAAGRDFTQWMQIELNLRIL